MSSGDFLDHLTRQDEILRDIRDDIREIKGGVDATVRGLEEVTDRELREDKRTVQMEFSTLVSSGTPEDDPQTVNRSVPFSGNVSRIFAGWQDGHQGLVGIGLELRDVNGRLIDKLFPYNEEDEYIAANDFTTDFDAGFEVESGQRLVGKFSNNDNNNDHFANLVVSVRED